MQSVVIAGPHARVKALTHVLLIPATETKIMNITAIRRWLRMVKSGGKAYPSNPK
jgi:hypothetical protein